MLDREVAAANIGDTKRQRVVSVDLNKIADVKLAANDTDGALAAVEESLNIARHVALTAPDNIEWQRDISVSLERLGNIKSNTGDKAGALTAYEEMLSIDRRAADADTDNLQRDAGGHVQPEQGRRCAARPRRHERRPCRLRRRARHRPQAGRQGWRKPTIARAILPISLDKVGDAKVKAGDAKGALAAFEEGLAIRKQVAEADKANLPVPARRLAHPGPDRQRQVRIEATSRERWQPRGEPCHRARAGRAAQGQRRGADRSRGRSLQARQGRRPASARTPSSTKALQLLARLDADGKLTDDQKGWSESFLTLRNGSHRRPVRRKLPFRGLAVLLRHCAAVTRAIYPRHRKRGPFWPAFAHFRPP